MPLPHALTIRTPPTLSPPSTTSSPTPPTFTAPPLSFLQGTWHVTHSTLPMWKKNRNVEITYTPIPSSTPTRLEDVVEYFPLGSNSKKNVTGIDTAAGKEGGELGAFDWRGKGWLKVVSSHWEVLGWGYIPSSSSSSDPSSDPSSADPSTSPTDPSTTEDTPPTHPEESKWMITWFGKTMFTPAGIDIYSRTKAGHEGWVVEKIKEALGGMEDEGMRKLGGEMFEVVRE